MKNGVEKYVLNCHENNFNDPKVSFILFTQNNFIFLYDLMWNTTWTWILHNFSIFEWLLDLVSVLVGIQINDMVNSLNESQSIPQQSTFIQR